MTFYSPDSHHLDQDSATPSDNPRVGGYLIPTQLATVSAPPGRQAFCRPTILGESNSGDHLLDASTFTVGGIQSER